MGQCIGRSRLIISYRTNRTNEGQLEWYAVQPLFMRAKSDVLFLLDCCSAASAATKVRDVVGTKKTIAACGFESKAAEPGAHSFTSELIDILTKWQNIPFSVAMLSSELLSNLKHHKPKPDMFNKVVESRSSPTHYFTTVNPRTPSIILRRHIRKQEIVEKCKSRKRRKVSFDSSPEEASSLSESSIPACAATVSDSSSEGFSSSEDIERKFFKYSRENHFSRGYISVNVIQAIDSSVFL